MAVAKQAVPLASILTFKRPGPALVVDNTGTEVTSPTDTLRLQHDALGNPLGIILDASGTTCPAEDARINMMQLAPWYEKAGGTWILDINADWCQILGGATPELRYFSGDGVIVITHSFTETKVFINGALDATYGGSPYPDFVKLISTGQAIIRSLKHRSYIMTDTDAQNAATATTAFQVTANVPVGTETGGAFLTESDQDVFVGES